MMHENNFALMDIEYIEISREHRCIRELYMLAKDGFTDFHSAFYACKRYKDLDWSHQRTFRYCQRKIHKLRYDPKHFAPKCGSVQKLIKEFIQDHNIKFIMYK